MCASVHAVYQHIVKQYIDLHLLDSQLLFLTRSVVRHTQTFWIKRKTSCTFIFPFFSILFMPINLELSVEVWSTRIFINFFPQLLHEVVKDCLKDSFQQCVNIVLLSSKPLIFEETWHSVQISSDVYCYTKKMKNLPAARYHKNVQKLKIVSQKR